MRLDPILPISSPALSAQGPADSSGTVPFGALFQQSSKESSGVRMTEQDDGSFLMSSADEVQKKDKDEEVSASSLDTELLQAMVNTTSFSMGTGDLAVVAAREVRSFLGMPAAVVKEAPIAMRIRFEKSPQGLVVVIHLHGERLTDMATQQKSVLQNRLSEVLDRSVTVRFVETAGFDRALEETLPQPQGFGQGRQGNQSEQQTQQFSHSEDDGDLFNV
jgi:hypothetical protein